MKPTFSSLARHFFVVNPVCFESRQKMEAVIAGVHRFFNESGNLRAPQNYAVHVSRFPRDAIGAIRRFADAVPSNVPLRVYAMGGDGILFDCLNGVIGLPNVELGIMPYGRQNDFYHIFGKRDRNVFNSMATQTCAPSVPVDAVYCGSNYALSYCRIGMEPVMAAAIKKVQKNFFLKYFMSSCSPAMIVYYMCIVGAMNPEVAKQKYRLWVDGENLSGGHFYINILNSSWYRGHLYYPDVDPTDGWLDITASKETSIPKMFRNTNKVMRALREFRLGDEHRTGFYEKHPGLITYRRTKKVLVASERPLVLSLDGELFYDKCIEVEIRPAAVRIIAPNLVTGEQS